MVVFWNKKIGWVVVGRALLLLCILTGCVQNTLKRELSTTVIQAEAKNVVLSREQTAWWKVIFQLPWQPETEPKWYLGTWIAGEVIAPILAQHADNIKLWRIHRRAVNDASGYTFSFIFYSSGRVAEKIYTDINSNTMLAELKQQQRVKQVVLDDLQYNDKFHIEDTSDPAWPISIRKTWPYFMMGASQMWLELIRDLQLEMAQSTISTAEKYQQMQDKITALWRKNGQHAWLHHLSALYGYSPLEIEY